MAKYKNPVLRGFYPDPSICRVGDTFYMVNSTFAYFPGVPVFFSKNLGDWKQIGNVLDRKSQLPLENCGHSEGIYAPSIRYSGGKYYLITTNVGAGGNFVVAAEHPEGPGRAGAGVSGTTEELYTLVRQYLNHPFCDDFCNMQGYRFCKKFIFLDTA